MLQIVGGIFLIVSGVALVAWGAVNYLATPARVRVVAPGGITLQGDHGERKVESGEWLYLRPGSTMTIGQEKGK